MNQVDKSAISILRSGITLATLVSEARAETARLAAELEFSTRGLVDLPAEDVDRRVAALDAAKEEIGGRLQDLLIEFQLLQARLLDGQEGVTE
ncbi:MAG: hypothetical protein AB7F89_16045 [Pirellulaceae bacterium]